MRLLGIGPRDVVALARHQRRAHDLRGPLLVTGMLAEQLARELGAGGDPTLVRTSGEPEAAGVFVRVVAGAATAEDERLFRSATRAAVPIVAVQTAEPARAARLPYVLAEDVVQVMPGSGFPVDEIADRIAAALGEDGAPLAASLPVLRDAVVRRRATEAAVGAAALAALGAPSSPRLPVLALAQARMLSDVAVASGVEQGGDGRESRAAARPPARGGARDRARRPGARPPRAVPGTRHRRCGRGCGDARARRSLPAPPPALAVSGPSGPGPRIADNPRSRSMEVEVPETELAEELLQIEEADAWFEYLESTRCQNETRYQELEPWAWARLSQRLRAVRARRARLRPAA